MKKQIVLLLAGNIFIIVFVLTYLEEEQKVESGLLLEQETLYAFSKAYGYIRYFYPNKEAAELDWEQFVVYGVEKISETETTSDLKQQLEELFHPIAPSLELIIDDTSRDLGASKLVLDEDEFPDNEWVFWQHFGLGTEPDYVYESRIVKNGDSTLHLFAEQPEPRTIIEVPLTNHLIVRVPITVTEEFSKGEDLQSLQNSLTGINVSNWQNPHVRKAGIIISWNLIQHFYPYYDQMDVKWDEVLLQNLKVSKEVTTIHDYRILLSQMLTPTGDGHIDFQILDKTLQEARLGFMIKHIDEHFVIMNDFPPLKYPPNEDIEVAIRNVTTNYIKEEERQVIHRVTTGENKLRFSNFIKRFRIPETGLVVICTNYDRLIEIACEVEGIPVDNLFYGKNISELNEKKSQMSFCERVERSGKVVRKVFAKKVLIYKPHGCLNWYWSNGKPISTAIDLNVERLIITPGANKYRNGYDTPFDIHI